ncbi:MAG: xylulokinase [Spirochaetaceae bacterium]
MSLLAVDIGTSRTKAALYDEQLHPVTVRSVATPGMEPGGAFDPAGVLAALEELVRDAAEVSVTAVGITSFLSHIMLDENGSVLGTPMSWSFRPSAQSIAACRAACAAAGYTPERPISGELLAPRLLHVAHEEGDTARRVSRVVSLKDFLRKTLSAEDDPWRTDYSVRDYSLIRDSEDTLIEPVARLLEEAGYRDPGTLLPETVPAHAPAGSLSRHYALRLGVSEGVPLAAGATDGTTAMYGGGLLGAEQPLVTVFGTTDVVMRVTPHRLRDSLSFTEEGLSRNAGLLPGVAVIGGSTSSSGGVAGWMERILRGGSQWPRIPAGSEGLLVAPGFEGERAPWNRSTATGTITGVRTTHTGAHIQRALLEAQLYRLRYLVERILHATSTPTGIAILAGGGRRTAELDALRREILPWPIRWREDGELSLAGAALFARAAGVEVDAEREAVLRTCSRTLATRVTGREKEAEVLAPSDTREVYEKQYSRWLEWMRTLYGGHR